MSSFYATIYVVDIDVGNDTFNPETSEIIEFAWIAYDTEKLEKADQGTYYIRPHYGFSERKLQQIGLEAADIENGMSLAEACQQFDTAVFTNFQKQRKPISLATFDVSRFYSILHSEASNKDIALFPHMNQCIDLAQLVRQFDQSTIVDDLQNIKTVSSKFNLPVMGIRNAGMDACRMAVNLLELMLHKGFNIYESHAKSVGTDKTPSPPPPKRSINGHQKSSAIIKLRGLPWEIDTAQLIDFISPVCAVNADDIHIGIGYDGRTNGEAFVVMPDVEYRDLAIRDLHARLIGRRWVEVFKSNEDELLRYLSNSRKMNGVVGGSKEGDEHVVRLRGIPWSCDEHDIVRFFTNGGFDIRSEDIAMGYGPDNRLTGDAWVILDSADDADRARDVLHKKVIGRRYIEVFPSSIDEMDHARHNKKPNSSSSSSYNSYRQRNGSSSKNFGYTVLRMRGLPFSANESHIMNFFNGFNMESILPATAPINGRPSGEAYVQFADSNEAWRACNAKNGHLIERRYIELFPATKQEMDTAVRGGYSRGSRERRSRPY